MEIKIEAPFACPDEKLLPHLEKVLAGEYEVPFAFSKGKVILDLGANFGAFSVWASHRWPGSTIHAYEPHPEVFKGLEKNLKLYPNVTAYNYGVGTAGVRPLMHGRDNLGESSLHMPPHYASGTGVHVDIRDPLSLPEADIIKLDIEGCEMEVLGPLIEAGRTFTLILMEVHSESLRRQCDLLLRDYVLIGSNVEHPAGRSVVRYVSQELHQKLFSEVYRDAEIHIEGGTKR